MQIPNLPRAEALIAFHDRVLATAAWKAPHAERAPDQWYWVEQNHRYNALLWAEEDLARRPHVPDAAIAENKRHIDGFNQRRNDAVERIDDAILQGLAATMNAEAPLHSETAGMMIDRLSILSLKIHAMHLQTVRTDVDTAHVASTTEKLTRLNEQRADLAHCLDALLNACAGGTRRYKIYRQFKMYNDPTLNPQIYGATAANKA
jgi:hypothetical protein